MIGLLCDGLDKSGGLACPFFVEGVLQWAGVLANGDNISHANHTIRT